VNVKRKGTHCDDARLEPGRAVAQSLTSGPASPLANPYARG
jgi:hypothetical protein